MASGPTRTEHPHGSVKTACAPNAAVRYALSFAVVISGVESPCCLGYSVFQKPDNQDLNKSPSHDRWDGQNVRLPGY